MKRISQQDIRPPADTPLYPIGTVARMLGISVMTLRLYEKRGLIIVAKGQNGQRLYSEKDIERLKCIRNAIVDQKISIEGIRTIQSMIPCYEKIQCPMEERLRCPAYTHPQAGCWTIPHTDNICATLDCRACAVYLNAGDCQTIRQFIRSHSKRFNIENTNQSNLSNPTNDQEELI